MEKLERIAGAVERAMVQDKLYLDPELNLAMLSERVDAKPYLVSKCLKLIMKARFSDYVNGFRIEAWKQLVVSGEGETYTLLALAHKAGFNSKASFNRAVKKQEGFSPSELKTQLTTEGQ